MYAVRVKFADGTGETFLTDGGETWALVEELNCDPNVVEVEAEEV